MTASLNDPYIRANVLISFRDEVKRYGCDARELLKIAGLSQDSLQKPDSVISYRLVCNLFEIASEQTKNPNFGIDWFQNADFGFPAMGPLIFLGRFARDIREWADLAQKYWCDATNGFEIKVIENVAEKTATCRFNMDPLTPYSRQTAELLIGNVCGMLRVVSDRQDFNPITVRFQHRAPQSISSHEQFFNCPIVFNADFNEIVYHSDFYDLETAGSLRLFKPMLGIYIKHRLRHLPTIDDTIKNHIALAISSVLGSNNCSMELIASGLGMSSKKMHRLLEKEDITFSSILDEVRQNMARHLLVDSNASVARITTMLDYSSNPAFTLAFKRWTGVSPLQYRKAERERVTIGS